MSTDCIWRSDLPRLSFGCSENRGIEKYEYSTFKTFILNHGAELILIPDHGYILTPQSQFSELETLECVDSVPPITIHIPEEISIFQQ